MPQCCPQACSSTCLLPAGMFIYMPAARWHVHLHACCPLACSSACLLPAGMFIYMPAARTHVHLHACCPLACSCGRLLTCPNYFNPNCMSIALLDIFCTHCLYCLSVSHHTSISTSYFHFLLLQFHFLSISHLSHLAFATVSLFWVAGLAETFQSFPVSGPFLPDVPSFQVLPDSIFPPQRRSSSRARPLHLHFDNCSDVFGFISSFDVPEPFSLLI